MTVVNESGVEATVYSYSYRGELFNSGTAATLAPGRSYDLSVGVGAEIVVLDPLGRCLASAVATMSPQTVTVGKFASATTVLPVLKSFGWAYEGLGISDTAPITLRYAQDPVTMAWPKRSSGTSVANGGRGAALFYSFPEVKHFVASLNVYAAGVGATLMQAAAAIDWGREALAVTYLRQRDDGNPAVIREVSTTGAHAFISLEREPGCFGYYPPSSNVACSGTASAMEPVIQFTFAAIRRPLVASIIRVSLEIEPAPGFPG